jgi:hypothetical protein
MMAVCQHRGKCDLGLPSAAGGRSCARFAVMDGSPEKICDPGHLLGQHDGGWLFQHGSASLKRRNSNVISVERSQGHGVQENCDLTSRPSISAASRSPPVRSSSARLRTKRATRAITAQPSTGALAVHRNRL